MTVWPVFVQGWQFECCGEPFAIGDQVAWMLVLHEDDDFGLPAAVSEVRGRPARIVVDDAPGVAVIVGGLTAWWQGGGLSSSEVRLRGLLLEDHHADAPSHLPETHGFVRRIQLVTHRLELTALRTFERAPVPPALRDVEQLPTSFAFDPNGTPTSETGVLVDLDVTG